MMYLAGAAGVLTGGPRPARTRRTVTQRAVTPIGGPGRGLSPDYGLVGRVDAPRSTLTIETLVTYKLPMVLEEYEEEGGRSPFGTWFADLDAHAAARVTVALSRIEGGNLSNVEPVGEGVSEYKIDFGPGYRVYFGMDGQALVILLIGGTKKRQQRDIDTAKSFWSDYKARKKGKS